MIKFEQRKIYLYFLYPLATIAFIILSIFFILSAKGYVFVYDDGIKVEKTGMIIVSTNPTGAQIYLDGKNQSKSTVPFLSTNLNNLKKGKYTLSLEKNGFYKWQKELSVYPEMVTWANYALLFSKNPKVEKTSFTGKLVGSMDSGDNKSSVLLTQNADNELIYLVNNSDDSKTDIFETAKMKPEERISGISIIAWSDDRRNLLVRGMKGPDAQYYLINTENKSAQNISGTFLANLDGVKFNPSNSDEAFALEGGILSKINFSSKSLQKFTEQNIIYYTLSQDGNIYYIQQDKNGTRSLWQAKTDFTGKAIITDGIPLSDGYDMKISSQNQRVALRTKDNTLYLITQEDNKEMLIVMGKDISEFEWSPDGNRIIYKNNESVKDFELVDYKKESREYLITNGNGLTKFTWYDNDHLLAEKADGRIEVMDFDGENEINLASSVPGTNFFFSADNHNINFFSKVNEAQFVLSRYVTEF